MRGAAACEPYRQPSTPAPRPTGMLQRIPAWMGRVTVTQARQSQECPPTPLGWDQPCAAEPPSLPLFHSPCQGLGFFCGISSSSDNKQSPAVTLWCESAGDGFDNVGHKGCESGI